MMGEQNKNEAEHAKIVSAVRALDYGMDAGEFAKRMKELFLNAHPDAISKWADSAEMFEYDTGHAQEKTLLEYYVEFSLIKQNYGYEPASCLFSSAISCPAVFELRAAAKLLHTGAGLFDVHKKTVAGDLKPNSIEEDMEFGKAVIAFVKRERHTKRNAPTKTGNKPRTFAEKLKTAEEKAKKQTAQSRRAPKRGQEERG